MKGREGTMTTLDEQYEALYGPLAPYSDFKKGKHIVYRNEGTTSTGKVIWVAAATMVAGRRVPCQSIVACDQHGDPPDVVMLGEIVVHPWHAWVMLSRWSCKRRGAR